LQRIQDRLLLGLFAGLTANIIKEAIAETAVKSGFTEYTCRRMAPLLVFNKKDARSWKGWIMGTTTDMTVAGLTGVLLTYTLTHTGKDYSWLKGIMVANGLLDQVFNAFARMLPQVKKDPNSNLLCKGIHTVFGIAAAYLITSFGHPALFGKQPSPEKSEEQKSVAQWEKETPSLPRISPAISQETFNPRPSP
jgi:hypothetical protein